MTTAQLRERLEEELAVAIATHRTGEGAGTMAREILARDKRSYYLAGITADAERAAFYDNLDGDVVLVPFDETGLDGLHSDYVDRFDSWAGVEAFLQERPDLFAWVHPRFQWVLE